MAKEITTSTDLSHKSSLGTINNILEELISVAKKMQHNILKHKWQKVFELTETQKEINNYFYKTISEISKIKTDDNKNMEIQKLKCKIRENSVKYKEVEFINTKLLDDALFVAKQKVKKIFNNSEKKTYTKDTKKESYLWNNNPVMLDRFV